MRGLPLRNRSYKLVCLLCLALLQLIAQRTGLVLSGGGSSGLCHVGVLKALEENDIPIDYVCGTSIGGLIGAYYAVGYTPHEIEEIVKTSFFQSITRGDLPVKYEYMIKKRMDYAAWLTLRYNFRDNYLKNLPTNFVNSIPIDYYLMETFTGAANHVHNNFDSLFVPYRCVAADVERKQTVVFAKGDMPSAIRASISYPFYLRPITIDGHILFDGGLYNNFPVDIMSGEFSPDFIIGSNVAEKNAKPDEDNLYLQLRTMLTGPTNFNITSKQGLLLEPWSDESVFNFDHAQQLIDSGYAETMRKMPDIKKQVRVRSNAQKLAQRRERFKKYRELNSIVFDTIIVSGLSKGQTRFIKRSLFKPGTLLALGQLKKRYFRLASEDKIKNIFPISVLDSSSNRYSLRLIGKKEKPFYFEPGAIVSNRPISEAFLGLQYNHLSDIGFSAYVNGYIGKLTTSTHSRLRFDIPGRIPFFIEPSYTWSRWDYYSSSILFYDFLKPAYLIQEDQFGELKVGVPVGNISQFNVAGGFTGWKNEYYQTDAFSKLDTADVTRFNYYYVQANYKINTLNRKMYATDGTLLNIRARFLDGAETYRPGNTSSNKVILREKPQAPWLQLKLTFENYIRTFKRLRIGIFGEGVYSTQSFFSNYQATILSAPAFNPTPESQTFFMAAYRAHKYLAGGVKAIATPIKNLDVRVEAYIFQPVQSILKNSQGKAEYSSPFLYRQLSGMAAVVYNSPIGPLSVGVNYYDQFPDKPNFSFFFHIGYIIFNRKSID